MFIIGDIHGQLELLKGLYENIKDYNEEIYSVGDIVDRGYSPIECIKFIQEKDIKAVKGNHEEMMVSGYRTELFGKRKRALWMKNGGWSTLEELEEYSEEEIKKILDWADQLPLYIHCENEKVVIMHAGINYNSELTLNENLQNTIFDEDFLWHRASYLTCTELKDVDAIFVTGHTPFKKIMFDDFNRYFIDTGAFHTGKLSCLRVTNDRVEGFSFSKKNGFKQQFSRRR